MVATHAGPDAWLVSLEQIVLLHPVETGKSVHENLRGAVQVGGR